MLIKEGLFLFCSDFFYFRKTTVHCFCTRVANSVTSFLFPSNSHPSAVMSAVMSASLDTSTPSHSNIHSTLL